MIKYALMRFFPLFPTKIKVKLNFRHPFLSFHHCTIFFKINLPSLCSSLFCKFATLKKKKILTPVLILLRFTAIKFKPHEPLLLTSCARFAIVVQLQLPADAVSFLLPVNFGSILTKHIKKKKKKNSISLFGN